MSRSPRTHRLDRLTRLVEEALTKMLPASAVSPQVVHEAMRYCVLSHGKRYRPLLTLAACEAVGNAVTAALKGELGVRPALERIQRGLEALA